GREALNNGLEALLAKLRGFWVHALYELGHTSGSLAGGDGQPQFRQNPRSAPRLWVVGDVHSCTPRYARILNLFGKRCKCEITRFDLRTLRINEGGVDHSAQFTDISWPSIRRESSHCRVTEATNIPPRTPGFNTL